MQEGIISRLIAYYLENEKYKKELERAKNIFFDVPTGSVTIAIEKKYDCSKCG